MKPTMRLALEDAGVKAKRGALAIAVLDVLRASGATQARPCSAMDIADELEENEGAVSRCLSGLYTKRSHRYPQLRRIKSTVPARKWDYWWDHAAEAPTNRDAAVAAVRHAQEQLNVALEALLAFDQPQGISDSAKAALRELLGGE